MGKYLLRKMATSYTLGENLLRRFFFRT